MKVDKGETVRHITSRVLYTIVWKERRKKKHREEKNRMRDGRAWANTNEDESLEMAWPSREKWQNDRMTFEIRERERERERRTNVSYQWYTDKPLDSQNEWVTDKKTGKKSGGQCFWLLNRKHCARVPLFLWACVCTCACVSSALWIKELEKRKNELMILRL